MEAYDNIQKEAWEELEVTRDELRTLTDSMKTPEFRKLLTDYANEVNDPENQKLYQSELIELERQRGFDAKFVKPEPCYCIKTSIDGTSKCFVNIAKNDLVQKLDSRPDGTAGLACSIPYMLSPPREDFDKAGKRCRVFDVIFHPDTLRLAQHHSKFRQAVNDTALDSVESTFKVKLDRKNLRFPKMEYKGQSLPTVIRKPCEEPVEKIDIEPEIYQKLMTSYDETRERHLKFKEKPTRPAPNTTYYKSRAKTEDPNSVYTTPKFVVKHQSGYEIDEFLDTKDSKLYSAIPKNLLVIINLPLLKSAADAALDVQERHLSLKSERPAKYHLELPLSYRVDPDKGNAKFDSKMRKLTVTLPVIRDASLSLDTKEDSGVESDHGSPLPDTEDPNDQVQSDCADDALRTSEDVEINVSFMNPNIIYLFPSFTCNLYDNVLAITIHAKNVDPDSIHHKTLEDNSGLHILLTSIGAGFFPTYYSLCLKIEMESIIPDTMTVEPWDNNVVLSVKINNAEKLSHYFAGIDEEQMESKDLTVGASIKNKLQALTEDPELENDKNVEVIRSSNEVIVNVRSNGIDSDDEDDHENESDSKGEEQKRNFTQSRSISESSGDELPSSIASSNGSGRYKSILKSRHNHISRSVSESSIDDTTAQLSSVTFNDSINELNSESEGSSLKKTVRFNDVVSRQLYRSNSSILGQRKKNQRKLRNKKRAHERRMSESENSETEEREKYKIDVKREPELDTSDAVRPILHQNKHSNAQQTANIEIERSPRNANKRKPKRNIEADDTSTSNENHEKVETENYSEIEEPFESKNDLIFNLDI